MGIRSFLPPTPAEIRFETDGSAEDVRRVLSPHVRPRRLFPWVWSGPPFAGVVTESGFRIRRLIQGRNSFEPVVRGEFDARDDGTTIVRVAFTPNGFAVLFPLIWFAALANFGLVATYVLVTDGHVLPLLSVGVLAAFGLLLLRWGWRVFYPREVERARRLLRQILEPLGAREVGPPADSCGP